MTSSDISTFEKKHDEITKVCDELRDEVHKLQKKVQSQNETITCLQQGSMISEHVLSNNENLLRFYTGK